MNREKFEQLVKLGIEEIPEKFLKKLDNVDIIIEDEPTPAQRKKLNLKENVQLFGLYQGVPKTKRRNYAWVLPDKITIFKNPIEKVYSSEKQIREKVKQTVWHEIAHHFGLDEQRVRQAQKAKYLTRP